MYPQSIFGTIFHPKIIILTAVKICSILHRRICVMESGVRGVLITKAYYHNETGGFMIRIKFCSFISMVTMSIALNMYIPHDASQ